MAKTLLDGNTMNAARNAARRGEKVEFRDTGTPGLAIRVKSKTPYFWFLSEHKKIQIAPMAAFEPKDIDTLRLLVPRIKEIVKDGGDPSNIISAFLGGERDIKKAHEKAAVKDGAWTWRILRDRYLQSLKDDEQKFSYKNNRSALGAVDGGVFEQDFENIVDMPINTIRVSDLAAVIHSVIQRGKSKPGAQPDANYNQAVLTYSGIKAAFKYAMRAENIAHSGLEENVALMLTKPKRPAYNKADVRAKVSIVPQLISIRKIEQFMFQTLWSIPSGEAQRRALRLQMLTGQRIETVITAHKSEFIRIDNAPWQYVWALGPDKMKAYRLLPLPEVASYIVHQAMKFTRPDNPFLFPKQRRRTKEDTLDGSISYTAVKGILSTARQNGDPIPPTFKGTHDFRRSFISHLSTHYEKLGLRSVADIDLITHKNEGRETVSQSVYNKDQFMRQKFKVLAGYQELLIEDRYDLRNWDITGHDL